VSKVIHPHSCHRYGIAEEFKKKRVAIFATRFLSILKKSQIKGGKSKKMVGFGNYSVTLHQN
jgi:hypothetical protein